MMTIHSFVDRFTELFSWLYYRHQWQEWELLTIAGVVLVPLLWVAKKQREERKLREYARPIRQSSPIIGIKLAAGRHSEVDVTDSKKRRLVFFAGKRNERTNTPEPSDTSDEKVRRLQREIIKRQQAEASLEQQLAELRADNKNLQSQINEGKKAEERLRQQTVKLLAANKRLQQGLTGEKQVEEHPKGKTLELLAADRLPRGGLGPRGQDSVVLAAPPKRPTDSRHANEPLDVQKLKAVAALAKQIQSRPRRA
ncbi:MAG: hypothetical protein JSW66_10625 [Phycisphaerales bacterium]|nr:MAG: hypothetical protein JSW66_10625 [Phycisphaerales bacterium]